MNITTRTASAILFLTLSVACGDSGPTSPSQSPIPASAIPIPPPAPAPPVPAPTPLPPEAFPPLTGPSRTFECAPERSAVYYEATKQSRFVLWDNGAFVLRFPQFPHDYRGRYTVSDGVLKFDWIDWPSAAASGTLQGDVLSISYNPFMQMADFEDAAYRHVN